MLLGQKLVVHTDHLNLVHKNFNSDRVLRWRLFLEEYAPDLRYIKGSKNVVADALSKMERSADVYDESLEMFYSITCFAANKTKEEISYDQHPVSYEKLEIA